MDGVWWVALGLVAWAIGLLFLFALFKVSGDEDRAARRLEDSLVQSAHVAYAQLMRIRRASATTDGRASVASVRFVLKL